MKKNLLSSLFLFVFVYLSAQQQYFIGRVSTESGRVMPYVTVYNIRTGQLVETDLHGNFVIQAEHADEVRFSYSGYERSSRKLTAKDFHDPAAIVLLRLPEEIEEVNIAFVPTGNLKKDLTYFKPSEKVAALNSAMSLYMMTPPAEPSPVNTIPSAFAPRNLGAGQIPLLSIGNGSGGGLLGLVASAFVKKEKSVGKPTISETDEFYRRVKAVINLNYFKEHGLSDYEVDIFLAHAEKRLSLAEKYRKNFNRTAIESELKIAFREYVKTFKPSV